MPVVYASDTPAGALLEVVAHAEAALLLSHPYVLFTIGLDRDRQLLVLESEVCPADWRAPNWQQSNAAVPVTEFLKAVGRFLSRHSPPAA